MATLRFLVRARPGASRSSVGGAYDGPRGRALVVAVTTPAVDGRATEAVLRAVAQALRVRRGAVSLVAGAGSRDKLVSVEFPSVDTDADGADGRAAVRVRLDELLGSLGRRPGRPVAASPQASAPEPTPDG
ncbi:MAG TPA: DUF167 domain-containing protein [Mycobacteriales bacterium]|nr:DUF167 domain-containing protein [Mycobacteriales bacterium]